MREEHKSQNRENKFSFGSGEEIAKQLNQSRRWEEVEGDGEGRREVEMSWMTR